MRSRKLNGKPIVDAAQGMIVRVTKRDVGKAVQKCPNMCAIANGCMHHSDVISARIGGKVALIELKDKVVRYSIKGEDQKKIRAFDAAKYFQSGTYELVVPKIPLGERTRNHSKKKRGPGVEWKDVYRAKPMRHAQRVTSDATTK